MNIQAPDPNSQTGEVSLGALKVIALFFGLFSSASIIVGLVGLHSEDRLAIVLSLTSGIVLGIFTLILVSCIIHESRSARAAAPKIEVEDPPL